MPLVNLTRANLRKAEFGFLGVMVATLIATPRLNGEKLLIGRFFLLLNPKAKAGDLVFTLAVLRPFFNS